MNNIYIFDDLYELLGVPSDASFSRISEAYRRMSRLAHPDKGGDVNDFLRLNKGYYILSDPIRRRLYDVSEINDVEYLDLLREYYPLTKHLNDYVPSFLFSVLDRLFNFKARTMASSIGLPTTEPIEDLGFSDLTGFSYAHTWATYFITQLVDKYLPLEEEQAKNLNDTGGKAWLWSWSWRSPFTRELIVEIMSTIISGPFEVMAYKMFRNLYKSNSWLFMNYFRTFFSSDVMMVLGLTGFRIGYTMTNYLFTTLADYTHYRSILARNEYHQAQIKERPHWNEEENGEIRSKTCYGELAWGSASMISTGMSYFVPSSLFSIYRLFYRLEVGPSVSYFQPTVLMRAGLLHSASHLTFDSIQTYYLRYKQWFNPLL
ncbi:hypothetical protein SAMD00019534_042170, partial [Acytostelium subglobosum LB1]|uniref:hypothetical protein n=1 Tax=Acytostelium subglobosum LB1 TaxID=1410327 RepID=UPI00064510CB